MSNIISFFSEQDSLHLRGVHHTGDSAKEPRGSRELSTLWGELPLYPIRVKGFGWLKAHFPFTYLVLTSVPGAARLMLYFFLLSLLLYIFSLKKVKGRLGGDSSPEQKDKTVLHFHLSLPQRQWGKKLSCQQTLW